MSAELDWYQLAEELPTDIEGVAFLSTDEALEWNFGHLPPEELVLTALSAKVKARICQLQLAAIRFVEYDIDETHAWLTCYQQQSGIAANDPDYI